MIFQLQQDPQLVYPDTFIKAKLDDFHHLLLIHFFLREIQSLLTFLLFLFEPRTMLPDPMVEKNNPHNKYEGSISKKNGLIKGNSLLTVTVN